MEIDNRQMNKEIMILDMDINQLTRPSRQKRNEDRLTELVNDGWEIVGCAGTTGTCVVFLQRNQAESADSKEALPPANGLMRKQEVK